MSVQTYILKKKRQENRLLGRRGREAQEKSPKDSGESRKQERNSTLVPEKSERGTGVGHFSEKGTGNGMKKRLGRSD